MCPPTVHPYTGIVFDLTGNLSLYGSYSSLFVPQLQKTNTAAT